MLGDYYVIGGCVLYIVGVGFCAYHCSMYNKQQELEYLSEKNDYGAINYSNV